MKEEGVTMHEEQLQALLKDTYRVFVSSDTEPVFSIPGLRLATPEGMNSLLETYGPLISALDIQVPAAYFCGSLVSLGIALQTAISGGDRAVDLSLENIMVEIHVGQYPVVAFRLREWRTEEAPVDPAARSGWLEQAYAAFYGLTMRLLIEAAAAASNSPVGSLWGRLPGRYDYYIKALKDGLEKEHAESGTRLAADYGALLGLPASVFGRARHPLDVKIRKITSLTDPGGTVAMRSACCLYYRTEGGHYCYTCPKLKEEDRAARRLEYETKQKAKAQ